MIERNGTYPALNNTEPESTQVGHKHLFEIPSLEKIQKSLSILLGLAKDEPVKTLKTEEEKTSSRSKRGN